ncbi:MAG: group II intron reverse transcriptase/maturase, partial [Spirochaetaceae bacterium]|nr:group II intron reverse transcriptase/maturase [Spirochaetaceae bacterium]
VSESSYGFRPGRSAHDAVLKACEYVAGGKRWVVDMDLEFPDGVNHDVLMARVARKVADNRSRS